MYLKYLCRVGWVGWGWWCLRRCLRVGLGLFLFGFFNSCVKKREETRKKKRTKAKCLRRITQLSVVCFELERIRRRAV